MERMVKTWQIVNCGLEYPDYFQGFGSGGKVWDEETETMRYWDDHVCGVGETPNAACQDAMEMLAESGWEWPEGGPFELEASSLSDDLKLAREPDPELANEPNSLFTKDMNGCALDADDERAWYVGIRVRG